MRSNFSFTTNLIAGSSLQFPNSTNAVWPGYTNMYPYLVHRRFVPNSAGDQLCRRAGFRYIASTASWRPYLTTNLNLPYETNVAAGFGQYPQPHWGVTMTNNLQVVMVDDNTGRLIDYVQLSGPNSMPRFGDGNPERIRHGKWRKQYWIQRSVGHEPD